MGRHPTQPVDGATPGRTLRPGEQNRTDCAEQDAETGQDESGRGDIGSPRERHQEGNRQENQSCPKEKITQPEKGEAVRTHRHHPGKSYDQDRSDSERPHPDHAGHGGAQEPDHECAKHAHHHQTGMDHTRIPIETAPDPERPKRDPVEPDHQAGREKEAIRFFYEWCTSHERQLMDSYPNRR